MEDLKAVSSASIDSDHMLTKAKFLLPPPREQKFQRRKGLFVEKVKEVRQDLTAEVPETRNARRREKCGACMEKGKRGSPEDARRNVSKTLGKKKDGRERTA